MQLKTSVIQFDWRGKGWCEERAQDTWNVNPMSSKPRMIHELNVSDTQAPIKTDVEKFLEKLRAFHLYRIAVGCLRW